MAKKLKTITVLVDSMADEQGVMSAINAAAASVSPQGNFAAYQNRDSEGKLVSVDVNLPSSVSQGSLQTAIDAINSNNGVSKASGGGYDIDINFDGYTPGDTLPTSYGVVPSQVAAFNYYGGEMKASADAQGDGGTAPGALLVPKLTLNNQFGSTYYWRAGMGFLFQAATNGLGDFKDVYAECYAAGFVDGGSQGDLQHRKEIGVNAGIALAQLSAQTGDTNWQLQRFNQGTIDSGIPVATALTIKADLNVKRGVVTLDINGTDFSYDDNVIQPPNNVSFSAIVTDGLSTNPATFQQEKLVLDSIKVNTK